MRISSRALWLLSALPASVAADDTAEETISFTGNCFTGLALHGKATTIMDYGDLTSNDCVTNDADGPKWQVDWAKTDELAQVRNIILASGKDQTQIATSYMFKDQAPVGQGYVFPADYVSGSLTFYQPFLEILHTSYKDTPLFLQVEWNRSGSPGKRDDGYSFSYSPSWALTDSPQDAQSLLDQFSDLSADTTPPAPAHPEGTDPSVTYGHTEASASASATTTDVATLSTSGPASASGAAATSRGSGLGTGPIVGIAVGGVALLAAASVLLGCVCIKRRRRNHRRGAALGADDDDDHHNNSNPVQTMRDLIAEKERRAGSTENALDTPYSEEGSQRAPPRDLLHPHPQEHSLARGVSGLGHNGSGTDVGGTGAGARASVDSGSHYSRHSSGYSSLAAVGTAVTTGCEGEGGQRGADDTSLMLAGGARGGGTESSPRERAFSPYRDGVSGGGGGDENSIGGSPISPADEEDQEDQEVDDDDEDDAIPLSPAPPVLGSIHDGAGAGGGGRSRAGTPTRFVRSTTPGAISQQYAHLVEEGMTEDEIRRLEEEERVLDEAIEQAWGDSRATGR